MLAAHFYNASLLQSVGDICRHARASPLLTAVANAGSISPLANRTTTASPAAAPLAGIALGSPGVMAALVIVGSVVIGA